MSDIRDELSSLIKRPDDHDAWGVDATQGHIRRAIMALDRLRAERDEARALVRRIARWAEPFTADTKFRDLADEMDAIRAEAKKLCLREKSREENHQLISA